MAHVVQLCTDALSSLQRFLENLHVISLPLTEPKAFLMNVQIKTNRIINCYVLKPNMIELCKVQMYMKIIYILCCTSTYHLIFILFKQFIEHYPIHSSTNNSLCQ